MSDGIVQLNPFEINDLDDICRLSDAGSLN